MAEYDKLAKLANYLLQQEHVNKGKPVRAIEGHRLRAVEKAEAERAERHQLRAVEKAEAERAERHRLRAVEKAEAERYAHVQLIAHDQYHKSQLVAEKTDYNSFRQRYEHFAWCPAVMENAFRIHNACAIVGVNSSNGNANGRTLYKGPNGGLFYFTSSGKRSYL